MIANACGWNALPESIKSKSSMLRIKMDAQAHHGTFRSFDKYFSLSRDCAAHRVSFATLRRKAILRDKLQIKREHAQTRPDRWITNLSIISISAQNSPFFIQSDLWFVSLRRLNLKDSYPCTKDHRFRAYYLVTFLLLLERVNKVFQTRLLSEFYCL